MIQPITLSYNGIRLEPLTLEHETGLSLAASDGELWNLSFTSVPEPDNARAYIELALNTPDRFAFAVIDENTNKVIGSTSYHDIRPLPKRLEIGYTWYAQSYWRTHVNTTCKYLLMSHAFETLNQQTVGWRTDCVNFRSQKAIERLGAKKDGVIRGFEVRRDGTVRDTVFYSMLSDEWAGNKAKILKTV